MTYPQHPLSAAFPAMNAEDFQLLKDDIETEGQREPVIILDGMVLDGWHRYRACIELGIKPTQFTFSDNDDPVAFVKSHNLHRRHLTGSQRAAAVIACSEWAPPNRLKNKQTPGVHLPKTNAQLAAEAHVSPVTIKDAKAAQRAGLGDVVKEGGMTAKEAAKVARGALVEPPKPAPKPEVAQPPIEHDGMLTSDELMEQMQETQAENEQLQERVELMARDDKAAEISKLLTRINGLEGRLHQAMNQIKASEDTTKVHAALIHKLRKLLGVEGHKAIYAAVSALVAERAEA